MMAGVETDTATGTPNIEQMVGEANSAAIDPVQTTTTQQVDPTQPTAPTPLMSFRESPILRPPDYGKERISNQDVVPHPDPRTIQHGKHAFSMPAFQLGAAAIGARLGALKTREQEVNKAIGQIIQGGPKEQQPDVPAPYLRSYHALGDQVNNDVLNSLAAQYGSMNKALRALANNDPFAVRKYQRAFQDYEDVGKIINAQYKQAEKDITDMESDAIRYDPKLYEAAKNLKRGLNELGGGGYGDVQKLLSLRDEYDRATTLPHFLTAAKFADHVKAAMAQTFKDEQGNSTFRADKHGGFTVFSHVDAKRATAMIDSAAERIYPMFKDQYASLDEFKKKMHEYYPVQEELKVDGMARPGSGKKGSGKNGPDGIVLGLDTIANEFVAESKNKQGSYIPGKASDTVLSGEHEKVRVLRIRNSDGSDYGKPVTVNDGETPVTMYPRYIMEEHGRYFLVGHSAEESSSETSTSYEGDQTKAVGAGNSVSTDKEGTTSSKSVKKKGLIRVPIPGNEENLKLILRGNDWRSYFGASSEPASTGSGNPWDDYK